MSKARKYHPGTLIAEIVRRHPEGAEILMRYGLGCVHCPMAQQETLEQGARLHGLSAKEIERILNELNQSD